ncbi:glycosyltransferase [Clostridium sporogenes]|uniref:Glycoside hydrolase n=3 Tax=Clostridium TaxID=1485 RepID=A0A0D1BX41_CLOBO|nr:MULTISPECIES: glycosyltransferase [Clostridium]MBE6078792.1 glycosyltransferase family 4 protein [Clostridium lundense]MDU2832796.1 glycosyltransferase [Clostridium botulinum]KIS24935.1 glycoside hydrolase [Clostridium botulinum B2 450]MCW6094689.1 glycosyltransferase [Clostridium sporogenes]MDU4548312.1 glycosyltransferase [Clostridium botulinum]
MNILIMSSWYPSKNNLVSGIFVYEQVKALKALGKNVIVFYPFDENIEKGKVVKSIEENIVVYRSNTDYIKNTKISRVNSIIKSVSILSKIVKIEKIDLIHAHVCYIAGIIASVHNMFYKKVPYIITEHSSKVKEYSNKNYNKKLFYFAYKNAQKVITVSNSLKNELKNLGYTFNDEIIGNIVDTNEYYIKDKNQLATGLNGLFIGLMNDNEVKGLQYFLPALQSVFKNYNDNIKFTLIGDGPKRKKYEAMVNELNINNICKFIGEVPKKEIPEYIMNHDFLVLPSVKETFGSVLIEAMAAGKPVLATKCGGPDEFVIKDVGILVEKKSEEALEKGLIYIIENYEKFNSYNIRKYAVENYSYEAIGNQLIDLYNSILN